MELSKEEKEAIKNLKLFLQKEENYMTNDKLEIILNLISKLQKENEKQSKVIDEMAGSLYIVDAFSEYGNSTEEIKQYFYRKVERRK